MVVEYDAAGNELRSYGYKPDSTWSTDPLWLKEGGAYYWYQNDHLGTPQKLVDSAGGVVWSATYSAFGEATISVETVTNNLRFPGQYFDAETGWHYNWNRYYDPSTGRYTRVDPIGFDGGDENLYAYVWNAPGRYVDITGLNPIDFFEAWLEYLANKSWGIPTSPMDPVVDDTVQTVMDGVEVVHTGTTIFCDAYDMAWTIKDCAEGNCNPWAIVGAVTPLVSGNALKLLAGIPLSEAKKLLSYWDKSSFETLAKSIRYMQQNTDLVTILPNT